MKIVYNHETSNKPTYSFELLRRDGRTTTTVQLSGKTVTFEMYGTDICTGASNLIASVDCTVTDATAGTGEFTLTDVFVATPGTYRGYIRVYGGPGDNLIMPTRGSIQMEIQEL